MSIGGSIIGGSGQASGQIFATGKLGPVTIKGDLRGGAGASSGNIHSGGKLGDVTIGGSLIGGSASHAGSIKGVGGVGKISIGREMRGGSAADTGDIQSTAGGIGGVKIGGSLIGGTASFSGRIIALGGDIGPMQIGGDFASNSSPTGTLLDDSGVIYAQIGTSNDAIKVNITSITIGGSVRGASNASGGGQLYADGTVGAVKIGRDVVGGAGAGSGKINGYSGIQSVIIGGDLVGAGGINSGYISSHGAISSVKIGGSILGGSGENAASIFSFGKLGSVTIGGDVITTAQSTGYIGADLGIGAVKIGGSLIGSTAYDVTIRAGTGSVGQLAIKSITIGGRVERANISSVSADSQIGPVKVGGDWIASDMATGINTGADGFFGTADDAVTTFTQDDPALFSKIASITIGGQVTGSAANATDHFGFVSQEIGSLKINGVTVPLTKGRSNDLSVTNTKFILGATRDVTVHEVM